jgi:hypothetical protein
MSTGGAATNATMKQIVAASNVGIISTPNQPTYKRLLVEVTHSQKDSHGAADCCLERVEAIVLKESKIIREMMVLLFLCALGRGIKDVFIHPIGLGLRSVTNR